MIVLKIGKEQFKLPESRAEITIRQMLDYCQRVEPEQPPSMKRMARYYHDLAKNNARNVAEAVKADRAEELARALDEELVMLTAQEKPGDYYRHYARVLSFFSGIPLETMLQANVKDLEKFHTILMRLINTQTPDPLFTGFEFKGERYELPNKLPVPMEDSTLIEFLEAEQYKHYYDQLMETDGTDEMGFQIKSHYNALLPIICILARKPGEPYRDSIVNERSELFLDLPLEYADQVFFYSLRPKLISTITTEALSATASSLMTSLLGPEN